MPAIKIENFSYAYNHTDKVLDNICLHVEKGSFTVLLGPSGAGKTTLCLAMAGAVPHYFGGSLGGSLLINNISTTETTMPELARTVGSVLQDYEIQLVTMTVEDEIAFSLENQGMDEIEIAVRTQSVLHTVGLSGYENSSVASLSGGQKQRLAVASVLAANPAILILDEPASALDPEGTYELYRLLGRLNREDGLTIVVAEHDIARVLPHADQFALLHKGQLLQAGPPAAVLTHLWRNQLMPEALPPLWRLKFALEAETGRQFAAWQTEQAAIEELTVLLSGEGSLHV